MSDFSFGRLTIARQLRGMTMKALAEQVGVSPATFTRYEAGKAEPSEEVIRQFVIALRLPRAFFFGDEIQEIDPSTVSFRSRRSTTAILRDKMLAHGKLAAGIISPAFRRKFALPPLDVPILAGEKPELAAQVLREHWKLGAGPIPNMVHLLESKGVEVYWIDEPATCLDAVSFWQDNIPFVILNRSKESGERSRFDAAHELAHLVLHKGVSELSEREIENEADRFSAAFHMPADQFREECPRVPVLSYYFPLKGRWKLSIQAMLRRTKDLNVISPWHYECACKEISRLGWRTKEPIPIELERSRLQGLIYQRLAEKQIDLHEFARKMGLTESVLMQLTPEAAALDISKREFASNKRSAAHLRLVAGGNG